jgi:hypothetical protein
MSFGMRMLVNPGHAVTLPVRCHKKIWRQPGEKRLPVDATQAAIQVRDLRNYCYFPWWSSKLNRSIRSPIAGRFKGT